MTYSDWPLWNSNKTSIPDAMFGGHFEQASGNWGVNITTVTLNITINKQKSNRLPSILQIWGASNICIKQTIVQLN